MICDEEMVDLRISDPKSLEESKRLAQLAFRLNHTMPMTDEYQEILKEIFGVWNETEGLMLEYKSL